MAPDGDAVGSSLGLWHFLNTQDKDATVIVPNAFPDFLKWMPGSKAVVIALAADIFFYESFNRAPI